MRSAIPIVGLVFLLGIGVVGGATVGEIFQAPGDSEDLDQPTEPILVFDIELDDSGDAKWNISARFPIGDPVEAAAFDELAAAFEGNDGDEYLPIRPFEVASREASAALDRSMWIDDVERSVNRTEHTGYLTLRFVWTGFALAEDDRVVVGDVFTATRQTWLSTLEANEYIRIHAPPSYSVESSGMPVDNRTMWMAGPADLRDAHLTGTFIQASQPSEEPSGTPIAAWVGGIGALAVILLMLILTAYHRSWTPVGTLVPESDEEADSDTTEPDADDVEEDEGPDSPLDQRALLSDEELIIALIEHQGGRMKQAAIVEETDWSNAKVSQLLSQMAEAGDVEKLRIGRENLISLPDRDGE